METFLNRVAGALRRTVGPVFSRVATVAGASHSPGFPAGHYYSPVPDFQEVSRRSPALFDRSLRPIPGVDLNDAGQQETFHMLAAHYSDLPFQIHKADGLRFQYDNPMFSYADAIVLACFLRAYRPTRVLEIGSGFSSAVMLDMNDHFLEGKTKFTFIDPDPVRLRGLLRQEDEARHTVIPRQLWEVDAQEFQALASGDFLFIDCSHVSKIGSDVNRLFFEVLPNLPIGVIVHIHDIFYPFEYPRDWVLGDRRAFNEAYLLRAFLTFNEAFQIAFWNDYFGLAHRDMIEKTMPLYLKNSGGSIWLRRLR